MHESPRPRLSVVMATFNGSRFLPAQLESLATQRRLPDELVCCDDGSTDSTVELLRLFAASACFPVVIHERSTNVGVHRNFSDALAMASGDVLLCCDQDDVWLPDKLHVVEQVFLADPAVSLVINDARLADVELNELGTTLWERWRFDSAQQSQVEEGNGFEVFARAMPPYGCTMSFRAALRRTVLPVPPGVTFDLWIGEMAAVTAGCRVVTEPLQLYRQHPGQVTGFSRPGLRARLAELQRQGRGSVLDDEIDRLEATVSALGVLDVQDERVHRAATLTSERLHACRRRRLARHSVTFRVPRVAALLIDGSYVRSASAWRSAVVDLLAPLPNRPRRPRAG